jgi:hypothetical protein
MKKIKYYYNTNTLRYEKLETPLRVLLRVWFVALPLLRLPDLLSGLRCGVTAGKLHQQNRALRDNYKNWKIPWNPSSGRCGVEKRDNDVYRAIFEANPIPDSARAKELEVKQEIAKVEKIKDHQLVGSITATISNLNSRIAAQRKSYDEVEELVKNKEELLARTPAIQPVSNKDLNRIASGFGYRIDQFIKQQNSMPVWISLPPKAPQSMPRLTEPFPLPATQAMDMATM